MLLAVLFVATDNDYFLDLCRKSPLWELQSTWGSQLLKNMLGFYTLNVIPQKLRPYLDRSSVWYLPKLLGDMG